MIKIGLFALLFGTSIYLFAATSPEKIFEKKCASCHLKTKPADKSKLIAPALTGIMRHLKMTYHDREKAIAFIKDYVMQPSKEKAICMPQKIKRFGLMPSQKGNITPKELEKVAGWMFDNFHQQPKNLKGCKTTMQKPKMKKPFLIKSKDLPHFVGMIQQNWDNPDFALTKTQKEQLTTIKKATLFDVKRLAQEVNPLVKKIATLTNEGVAIEKIMILVDKVALLKAKATKVHLECIQKTKEILTPPQLEMLLGKNEK
jgi:hypothetical protein